MQIVDSKRFDTIDQGVQARPLESEPGVGASRPRAMSAAFS